MGDDQQSGHGGGLSAVREAALSFASRRAVVPPQKPHIRQRAAAAPTTQSALRYADRVSQPAALEARRSRGRCPIAAKNTPAKIDQVVGRQARARPDAAGNACPTAGCASEHRRCWRRRTQPSRSAPASAPSEQRPSRAPPARAARPSDIRRCAVQPRRIQPRHDDAPAHEGDAASTTLMQEQPARRLRRGAAADLDQPRAGPQRLHRDHAAVVEEAERREAHETSDGGRSSR